MSYQPLRRVPESADLFYLQRRMLPAVPGFLESFAATLITKLIPKSSPWKVVAEEQAEHQGAQALNRLQDIFFHEPGLDTLLVRQLTKTGRLLARIVRIRLWVYISLGRDRTGLARRNLRRIPHVAYDSTMLSGLAIGKALGYFTGGDVHTHIWYDSGADPAPLPEGHPQPQARRFNPPLSLGDLAADIDDLYWSEAYGQGIKITSVGSGNSRRWLVSIPGTDHPEPESGPNVADLEANMREELNIPSAMRVGVIEAIHAAMDTQGVPTAEHARERVLLCGHSQGGIIAVALAAEPREDIGFQVAGVITMGSPARRHRIPDGITALALEHVQDAVPAFDGTPRKVPDRRVVVQRSLTKPRVGALYYAHASSTYTDTLRRLERNAQVTRWGRTAGAISKLQRFLPRAGEQTRVFHQYIWQDVLPSHTSTAWDEYLQLNQHQWEPVTYGDEVALSPDVIPTAQEVIAGVSEALEHAVLTARKGLENDTK